MKTKRTDFIDFERINLLLEGFNKATGFVTAILDLDGNILSKSGWRTICTDFHRVHPGTSKRCKISDTELAGKLGAGEKYHSYKCLNGLVDVAVPIIIEGEHIANLFSGQFFFEKPSRDFFIKQAQKYKFDKKTYLEALDKVPVVSEEKVKTAMDFLQNMTSIISEMTQQRIVQFDLNKTLKESEDRWQFAIEENGDGLFDWNVETNEVFYSKQWKAMLGFEDDEIENKFDEWEKRLHPDDKAKVLLDIQKHLEGKTEVYINEHRLLCKDGNYKWIEDRGKIISKTKNNKPLRFIGTHKDITEQKQLLQELKESEEKYKALFDNAPLSYQSLDEKGFFIDINPSWLRTLGYEHDEVIGKDFADFLHPDWKPHFEKNFPAFKKRGYVNDVQYRIKHKKGHFIDISFEGCIGYFPDGSFKQTYCVFQDITERKHAEDELRKQKEMFELVINSVPARIFWKDLNSVYLGCNRAFTEAVGLPTIEAVIGKNDYDLIWAAEAEKYIVDDKQVISTGISKVGYDEDYMTPDGKKVWWHSSKMPLKDNNGEIFGVLATSEDYTERKQAQKALQESEEKFRTFIQKAPIALCHVDNNTGMIKYVNNRFVEKFGYTLNDIPNLTEWFQLAYPDETYQKWVKENWEEAVDFGIKNSTDIKSEIYSVTCKNGDVRQILISGIILGDNFLATFVDLTDQKNIEAELQKHKENLETLVRERTNELEKKYTELERMNKLFVGRELRMVELKEKIKELKNK